MRRYFAIVGLLVLLSASFFSTARAQAAQSDQRCFSETGYCISGVIRQYWEGNGGLPVFGYPTGPVETMTIENWSGPAQWFERDRLEDHSAQRQGVLAGRLGAERLQQLGRPWVPGNGNLPAANCRLFGETGYAMCGAFRQYWENNGGLMRFGYPISAEITESIEGHPFTVQYFERRRMEWHPENQPPYQVLLGLLGNEVRNSTRPASCAVPVLSELRGNYNRYSIDSAIGCPLPGEDYSDAQAAAARFERGQMYWVNLRGGQSIVIVLFYDPNRTISYDIFDDDWREGDAEVSGLTPPLGLYEPRRGFGKVWREQPDVRDRLGWALELERTEKASLQIFEYSALMRLQNEKIVWQLQDNGSARSDSIRYN